MVFLAPDRVMSCCADDVRCSLVDEDSALSRCRMSAPSGKAGGLTEVERLKAAWPFGRQLRTLRVARTLEISPSSALLESQPRWHHRAFQKTPRPSQCFRSSVPITRWAHASGCKTTTSTPQRYSRNR